MKEMKQYTIAEVCSRLSSGKGIPASKVTPTGQYPVIGGNGIRGYTDSFNFDGECAVIGRQGANCGNVRYFQGKAYMTEHAIVAIGNEKANTKYLACLFSLMHLGNLSAQSAQPGLSVQTLSKQIVNLPHISTQNQIADIIRSLDTKIELNKYINDNLEQQAQALYKSWFVDFEPFKDGEFMDSELGLIPEGWHVGKAGDFYEINIGKTPPRKEHEWFTLDKSQNIWISISDLGSDGRFLFNSSEYLTDKAIQKHNIVLVPADTVLLSFKLTIGRVGIAGTQLTTNEAIARFITNSVNREYTYFLLKNFNYSKLGSTSSIATAVNSKIIKAMMVLMPSNECLLNFKKLVGPIIDGIKKNEEEILRLTALRDNLLPKLMSGELKINELDC